MRSPFAIGPGAFRLILALFVVASHLSRYEIGRPAVFVFFMLSGYWVMKMFAEKYKPAADVWVFYLSRWLRIWLPFAVVFSAVYFLRFGLAERPDPEVQTKLWGILLLGIATTNLDVLGVSWSLDIEIQFYLLIPLIYFSIRRVPLAVFIFGAAVLSVAGWILQSQFGIWTVLSYLPSFLAGVLIWARGTGRTGRTALAYLTVFLAVAAMVWLIPYLRPLLLKDVTSPFNEDWFGIAWTMILLPLVDWNVRQRSGKLDRHMGALSFMLYIVHWPVVATLGSTLAPISLADKAVLLLVILIAATLVYALVDLPIERWRAKLVGGLIHRGRARATDSRS